MERKKASDFDRGLLELFDGYVHGFHNDTTPRYDEEAARLAWQRTLEFFEEHLH